MCLALGLTRPSMYFRARAATGSAGPTLPLRSRPVRTTQVTPGVLLVLQPPLASWVLLRKSIALPTTAFHLAASTGAGLAGWAAPRGLRAPSKVAQATAAAPVQHSRFIAIHSAFG